MRYSGSSSEFTLQMLSGSQNDLPSIGWIEWLRKTSGSQCHNPSGRQSSDQLPWHQLL